MHSDDMYMIMWVYIHCHTVFIGISWYIVFISTYDCCLKIHELYYIIIYIYIYRYIPYTFLFDI